MDDGMQKKVTEAYVVDALTFTEAEKRITEEMSSCIRGEFEVNDIKRAHYKEIFFSDLDTDDAERCGEGHRRGDGRHDDRLRHCFGQRNSSDGGV